MTKLPSAVEQRQIPDAPGLTTPQVVSADTSQVYGAVNQLGKTLDSSGELAHKIGSQQDKFNYSVARSKFLQQSVDLENQLDNDPDYANLPKKYEEGMAKIKEDTLGALGQNHYSRLLDGEINLYKSKKLGAVEKLAGQKQVGFAVAEADKVAEGNLDAFTRTKDPVAREAFLFSSKETYANAIPDNNPDKPVLVQKYAKATNKRFVEADLAQRSPAEQISLIENENKKSGSNLTKFLAADERQDWLGKAKIAQRQQEEDAVRKAAKADRLNKLNTDNELLKGAEQGLSFDQLPTTIQLRASEEDVKRYDAIRNKRIGSGQINSTPEEKKYFEYQDLYTKNPQEFSKLSPLEIANNVPVNKQAQVLKWHDDAIKDIAAPVSLTQYNNIADETLKQVAINPSSDSGTKFKTRLNEEVDYFKQNNKRDPNQKELQDMASGLVVKASFEGALYGTNEKRLYQVPKDKVIENIVVPEDFSNRIITQARSANLPPLTQDQIKAAYLRKLNER